MLKTGDRPQEGQLDILRQGGGEALQIDFLGVEAHRLNEELVAGLLGKPHHLVLEGRTVAGTDRLDPAAVDGGAADVLADHFVGLLVGVGDVAVHLVAEAVGGGGEAEGDDLAVAVLAFKLREVDAAAVDPGGGAGLEPADVEAGFYQAAGQRLRRRDPVRAGGVGDLADVDGAAEVGAGGDDRRLYRIFGPQFGADSGHVAIRDHHFGHFRLPEIEVFGRFQQLLHVKVVLRPVGLHPQAVDGRTFASVEHPALDEAPVGGNPHHPAQRVDLPHQMTFGSAADRRVAGEVRHRVQRQGKQHHLRPQLRRRHRRFNPGMSGADHRYIITFHWIRHISTPFYFFGLSFFYFFRPPKRPAKLFYSTRPCLPLQTHETADARRRSLRFCRWTLGKSGA